MECMCGSWRRNKDNKEADEQRSQILPDDPRLLQDGSCLTFNRECFARQLGLGDIQRGERTKFKAAPVAGPPTSQSPKVLLHVHPLCNCIVKEEQIIEWHVSLIVSAERPEGIGKSNTVFIQRLGSSSLRSLQAVTGNARQGKTYKTSSHQLTTAP
ncbi:unnamed protein product [Pleuronectes platessa]|uniref:Uncharacterized protein n=1 Tax=Pleuronectes platessa TaxID=8262 RepID=A0A9N7Z2Y1_PLEPL|nr:unnamed protein product [Pleuronectes platessa]